MAKANELGKQLAEGKGAELATGEPKGSLRSLLESANVKGRFNDMLGKKAAGFMSSIISVTNQSKMLSIADPMTVIAAASVAASIDLPILPALGFAHIVPYKDGASGKVIAQFQMGWRGFVQLAQRTGIYKTMNAGVLYEGQLKRIDLLSGEIELDAEGKTSDKVIGYFAHFELLNGFRKTVFITKEDAEKHGKRYSKSYNNGQWTKDTESANAMGTKTVVKRLLGRWAPLSADYQMQKALQLDQSVAKDIGAEPEYPDNGEALEADVVTEQPKTEGQNTKKDSPVWLCPDCGKTFDTEVKVCSECKGHNIAKQG